jgi:hypothetical protein
VVSRVHPFPDICFLRIGDKSSPYLKLVTRWFEDWGGRILTLVPGSFDESVY